MEHVPGPGCVADAASHQAAAAECCGLPCPGDGGVTLNLPRGALGGGTHHGASVVGGQLILPELEDFCQHGAIRAALVHIHTILVDKVWLVSCSLTQVVYVMSTLIVNTFNGESHDIDPAARRLAQGADLSLAAADAAAGCGQQLGCLALC